MLRRMNKKKYLYSGADLFLIELPPYLGRRCSISGDDYQFMKKGRGVNSNRAQAFFIIIY